MGTLLLQQLQREYSALSARERAGITRRDLEWLAAIVQWAVEELPSSRAELDSARGALALISFWSWRPRLRLLQGGRK